MVTKTVATKETTIVVVVVARVTNTVTAVKSVGGTKNPDMAISVSDGDDVVVVGAVVVFVCFVGLFVAVVVIVMLGAVVDFSDSVVDCVVIFVSAVVVFVGAVVIIVGAVVVFVDLIIVIVVAVVVGDGDFWSFPSLCSKLDEKDRLIFRSGYPRSSPKTLKNFFLSESFVINWTSVF